MRHERLKEIRELRQLTQRDLAERCGVAANTIYRYETGEVDPSGDVIARLCRELRVSADYLLGLADKPTERYISPENIDPEALKVIAAVESQNPSRLLEVIRDLIDVAGESLSDQWGEARRLAEQAASAEVSRAQVHDAVDRIFEEADQKRKANDKPTTKKHGNSKK